MVNPDWNPNTTLGDIFEQSLPKGKRKKEGIFYTPEYITKYIVEQAVGGWLADQRQALGFNTLPALTETDYASIRLVKRGKLKGQYISNEKVQQHVKFLEAYREKLRLMKVLDPACGSGAFLNQVFDFLYNEGQSINADLAHLQGGQTSVFDLSKHILTNNLYGVDINDESVEITKLSLWLKTADRNKELTSLDKNILCGNSLIDDPSVSDKAFKWEEHFAEIMQTGGFDVVVGNPPYGAELLNKNWLKRKFPDTSFGNINSYKYFINQSINLMKNGTAKMGYIVPDSYLDKEYFQDLRTILFKESSFIKNIKLGDGIFENVEMPTALIFISKGRKKAVVEFATLLATHKNHIFENLGNLQTIKLSTIDVEKSFIPKSTIINPNGCETLINLYAQVMGVKVYQKGKGNPKQTGKELTENIFVSAFKKDNFWYPFISNGINRYFQQSPEEYILYGEHLAEPRKLDYFFAPKVVVREVVNPRIFATYIEKEAIVKNTAAVIIQADVNFHLKYLLTLLNSKLFSFYFFQIAPKSHNNSYPSFNSRLIKNLPIKKLAEQQPFVQKADIMLQKNEELHKLTQKFLTLLTAEFSLPKVSKKLQNWHTLTWQQFDKELQKQKVKLSLAQKIEWLGAFETEKTKAKTITATIEQTDREIDAMVYRLYGLTAEEIKIVENL